jgi:hypothetical protein
MALLYRAELHPTKLELLAGWLPGRRWYQAQPTADIVRVAAYRFDDPAGAVGIETMLIRAGDGPIYQVPLTYRHAPPDGVDGWLIGTAEHSVLGQRWVYDACGDPVYASVLASAIFAATGQAEEFFEVDGRLEPREPTVTVTGGGGHDAGVSAVHTLRRAPRVRLAELTPTRAASGPCAAAYSPARYPLPATNQPVVMCR